MAWKSKKNFPNFLGNMENYFVKFTSGIAELDLTLGGFEAPSKGGGASRA